MTVFRLLMLSAFSLLPQLAASQSWMSGEFDARLLSQEEKRFVQAALIWSGDYVGLLDGAWGKGSQRSLEVWSAREADTIKPEFRHIGPLLSLMEAEIEESGWETFNIDATETSFAAPFAILTRQGGDEVLRWDSFDGGLSIIAEFSATQGAIGIHQYMLSQAASNSEPYQSIRAARLITAVELGPALQAYVRSDLTAGGWFTLTVIANSANQNRLQLIAGSIQTGRAPDLVLPKSGLLALLISHQSVAPDTAVATNLPAAPAIEADKPQVPIAKGSGTGFYVSPNAIVTAAHVIEGCSVLALADGVALEVLGSSPKLDLAVLSSSAASDSWISLVNGASARLGEQVTALGYPYLSLMKQGLTVTGGNVSALAGLDGGTDRIMFSAPVQPGNSGGPLLNSKGSVVGVVVARTDDLVMLKETGTLPQNMNLAVPPGALTGFLRDANVALPDASPEGFDVADGIPPEIADAVVPIFCY